MTTWQLVPLPGGFYAEDGYGNEAYLEDDIAYLCDGDTHAEYGPWNLRSEVLVVPVDESLDPVP